MKLISKVRQLMEPDFDVMSDGQMSDYIGEEESGDFTNYGVNWCIYECKDCGEQVESDE